MELRDRGDSDALRQTQFQARHLASDIVPKADDDRANDGALKTRLRTYRKSDAERRPEVDGAQARSNRNLEWRGVRRRDLALIEEPAKMIGQPTCHERRMTSVGGRVFNNLLRLASSSLLHLSARVNIKPDRRL